MGNFTALYDFTANARTATITDADGLVSASAITAAANMTLTVGSASYASQPTLATCPRVLSTSASAAVTNGAYFEFTVGPNQSWTPTSITVQAARGGASSPRGLVVRSSVDNFAADLYAANVTSVRPTFQLHTVPLGALGSPTGPVTFRVYAYSPGTSNIVVEMDDLTVQGTYTPPNGPVTASPATVFAESQVGQPYAGPADVSRTIYRFTGRTLSPTETRDEIVASAVSGGPGLRSLETGSGDTAGYDSAPVLRVAPNVAASGVDEAIAADTYFEITLGRPNGGPWRLDRIRLKAAKGGTGVRGFGLRSSADGYATSIIGGPLEVPTTRPVWTEFDTPVLSGSVIGSVTFRVYVFVPASGNSVEFDDIEFLATLPSEQSAAPLTVTSTASFGSPALVAGPLSATPATRAPLSTLGQPLANPGPRSATPLTRPSTATFGQPGLSAVSGTTPLSVASTASLGQPSLSPGPRSTAPATVPAGGAVGVAVASPGPRATTTATIPSGAVLGQPGASGGPVSRTPSTTAPTSTLGQPSAAVMQAGSATPTTITSGAIIGAPTLSASGTAAPATIASTATLGQPTAAPGSRSLTPLTRSSTAALGQPSLSAGPRSVAPLTRASTASIGTLSAAAGTVTTVPATIGPAVTFGAVQVRGGDVSRSPLPIVSTVTIGEVLLSISVPGTLLGVGESHLRFGVPMRGGGAVRTSITVGESHTYNQH